MKTKLYYCLLGVLCILSACKKDDNPKKQTQTQLTDSLSYTINGKNYALTEPEGWEYGVAPADVTYDPATGHSTKNADSTMFLSEYSFQSDRKNPNDTLFFVGVYFFRKYALKDMVTASPVNYPVDQSALYAPGSYVFAADFIRNSTTNGVAINIGRIGQSYPTDYADQPTTITQAEEKNSSFVITSVTSISGSNSFWIQAKFNAVVFDVNEKPIPVTNGYARIKVDYRPATN